ncbi:hypothetical protein BDV24DRAFT_160481 [Aspergillus arachidicola]|uniref:Uncharacterized protein n=1 Tax=Aspergillus arachidicola TaxID=656916 RepID=A0A5N6YGH1_9EURO|nr:hypothetical protein BDV24DRAFT_160481 [Aspergillus arachidicola]
MVQAKAVTSKIAVQERLPDLNISDARTTSSAIHNIDYLGPLCPWPNFLGDVEGEFLTHNWANNRHRLYLRPLGEPTPHSLLNEHCLVGNETGVQGRWQTHLGEVMSAVFQEQQFQLAFADFVSSGKDYNKNPDLVMINVTPDIMVVGQILAYMYDLEVKFGILSNYEQTLFLRLHEDPITGREVQYSRSFTTTHHTPQDMLLCASVFGSWPNKLVPVIRPVICLLEHNGSATRPDQVEMATEAILTKQCLNTDVY